MVAALRVQGEGWTPLPRRLGKLAETAGKSLPFPFRPRPEQMSELVSMLLSVWNFTLE